MAPALAAHPLSDEQFALEENRFLAQIHSSPEEIVPLLRKFWEGRRHGDYTPNLVPLTSVLGRLLFCDDIPQIGRRTWSALMSSGLPDLLQEMIMHKDFLTEYARWILQVLTGLVAVTRQCENYKDTALANRILVKSQAMWKGLWDRREALYPGPNRWIMQQQGIIGFHRLITEKIALLVVSMTELYVWRNRMVEWFQTHIRHISFYCWFRHDLDDVQMPSPTPELALHGMSVQMGNTFIEDELISGFGKEMICLLGAQPILDRMEQDFKNSTVTDTMQGLRISIVADFARHEEMQWVLGRGTYFQSIVNVLRGMKERRWGKEWEVWSLCCHMLKVITLNINKYMMPGFISSVRGDDAFYILSRGVTLCAQDPAHRPQEQCTEMLRAYHVVATEFNGPLAGVPEREMWFRLKETAKSEWHPALQALRDARHTSVGSAPWYGPQVEGWIQLGGDLGLKEETERDRRGVGKKRFCSWAKCRYHTEEPSHPLKACRGCGDVRYCDRSCQMQDWKEGEHKKACRRLMA